MNRLKIGSKVLCRYFNTPENRFYGEYFTAEIIKINIKTRKSLADNVTDIPTGIKTFTVKHNNGFMIDLN